MIDEADLDLTPVNFIVNSLAEAKQVFPAPANPPWVDQKIIHIDPRHEKELQSRRQAAQNFAVKPKLSLSSRSWNIALAMARERI